ncbi:hypothetical protein TNCT_496971 [Trichonephila clavata]|uniref:Uncharacterized protein n=1 Tax=Trichonephila clavata TaxID=2740835 RepID=A0A8X6KI16_TRICU|nr:hypothetical protein TNCT_496971 [Trichonephila clavata]
MSFESLRQGAHASQHNTFELKGIKKKIFLIDGSSRIIQDVYRETEPKFPKNDNKTDLRLDWEVLSENMFRLWKSETE